MSQERHRLRSTFDEVALLYDQVRPGYPEALFEDVVALSGIPPGGRVLEVGCGTGQATLTLARRGYRILGVELGENLAAVARQKLAGYPGVEVRRIAFEEWPVEEGAFDLVVAATSFHWIDPAVAYPRAARALRPGGAVAIFTNEHVQGDNDGGFFEAVQELYDRLAPVLVPEDHKGLLRPDELPESGREEIERSGLFGPVAVRRYCWDAAYDAEGYLRLLDTYSGHRTLDAETRAPFFRAIAALIDTHFVGRIVKSYASLLYVARRT